LVYSVNLLVVFIAWFTGIDTELFYAVTGSRLLFEMGSLWFVHAIMGIVCALPFSYASCLDGKA
jgi:hypothetical protein